MSNETDPNADFIEIFDDVLKSAEAFNALMYRAAEIYGYEKDADGNIQVTDVNELAERVLEDVANYNDLQNS